MQGAITEYIWAHKSVRTHMEILMRPKELGGLEVPNLYLYSIASHLNRMLNWAKTKMENNG